MSKCEAKNLLNLIQNSDSTFGVRLVDKETSAPFDITPYPVVHAVFIKDDGAYLTKSTPASAGISILSAEAGQISISLSAADTVLLPAGDGQSFEVELYQNYGATGQTVTVVQFLNVLNIAARI